MNAAIPGILALLIYIIGYRFYAKFLSEKIFQLRENVKTPAHVLQDGIDYVPTRKLVLFGHHYASIAGLAPMLGPAVAVIWGWFPAMMWVVFGALLIGCVHDFGSMVVSLRARGMSIGKVAEGIIGRRAKTLFHLVIFFLVALAMGVFVYVISFLLSPAQSPEQESIHFPQAIIPSFGLMVIAAVIGWLGYRKNFSWKILTPVGFVLLLVLVVVAKNENILSFTGLNNPAAAPDVTGWSAILLFYAFLASVLPVWSLLQPRDFLNSLLLYFGLGGLYIGFFILQPEFVAPAVRLHPEGAPGLFPFVFIIIACGAASGFHSLVASGTTAKQLDKETDARFIGYGAMVGESMLGLIAVLATTAGIISTDAWEAQYASWTSVQGLGAQVAVFIQGCSTFLNSLGIDRYTGSSFISLIVVSYALTSLDSATRLLRYNIEEISETFGISLFRNRFLSSLAAIIAIGFFAFYKIDGRPAGLALWQLFGTTNQLLAGLALLAVTLYLLQRGKPWYFTGLPMIFMLITTLRAMTTNLLEFFHQTEWPLFFVGFVLLILAVWLMIEAVLALRMFSKKKEITRSLDVFPQ
ncbi:MAG: carbon starvation protein A [Calditrichaeota bacterium]|nr:carbon starvation protein A [Calditrichota bacterium]RQV93551.1 MAG: carbon starvation protein A [bacterium]RQW06484.1 MAG: carbon starvation protein A [Calditrichota bacterium]